MATYNWGLLGPEVLPLQRRTRTLGLGASVRRFNDLAVPGMGGVWFGKQLMLATLGVVVAEQSRAHGARVQNIEVANAIEALGCWLAFRGNGWEQDARLRGRTKLPKYQPADFSFRRARQRGFYVTQPMRMATVEALHELGLVESESPRFNTYRCSEQGHSFIEKASEPFRPYNRNLVDHLVRWVRGLDEPPRIDTEELRLGLSPREPLPECARKQLRELLVRDLPSQRGSDRAKRRRDVLKWVRELPSMLGSAAPSEVPSLEAKPAAVESAHWKDIRDGALFFRVRDAALDLLNAVENTLGNRADAPTPELTSINETWLPDRFTTLRQVATEFLRDADPHDALSTEARRFCRDCSQEKPDAVLRALVKRDGVVLRLVDDDIRPGPAFKGVVNVRTEPDADDDTDEPTLADDLGLSPYISYRVRNLFLLQKDLEGKLESVLRRDVAKGEQ